MNDLSGIEQRQVNLTINQTPENRITPTNNFFHLIKESGDSLDGVMVGILKGTYQLKPEVDKNLILMRLASSYRPEEYQAKEMPIKKEEAQTTDLQAKRTELINLIHSTADMVVNARNTISALGENVWDKSDYEIWELLHQNIFGTSELTELREKYPRTQIRAFHIGFLRFLNHFEAVKAERLKAIENPTELVKKCFKKSIGDYELQHKPALEATPLALVIYLHQDDYQVVHESGFIKGGYVGVLEDYPQLSHRVVIINTDEAEPEEGNGDFRVQRTLQHELQHAFHYVFFQEFDIEALEKLCSAIRDPFDSELHAATSRFLRQYFLEHEKNEAISYNYDPLQINEEKSGNKLYREFVDGGKAHFTAKGANEATQDKLDKIYKDDYQRYMEDSELFRGAINMIYGNAQQLGVSKEHIESLLQITPVTKIIRTIKSIMGIRTHQDMIDAVREYQIRPIREMEKRMAEENELNRRIMHALEKLRDEGE